LAKISATDFLLALGNATQIGSFLFVVLRHPSKCDCQMSMALLR
jgi:hypothetical protein